MARSKRQRSMPNTTTDRLHELWLDSCSALLDGTRATCGLYDSVMLTMLPSGSRYRAVLPHGSHLGSRTTFAPETTTR